MGRERRFGYTLIEVLVVASITSLLAGMLILQNSVGQRQITMSVEIAKLSQIVLKAKAYAVATYNDPGRPCGFGIHVDYSANKYSLRSYRTQLDCVNVTGIASSAVLQEFLPAAGLVLDASGANKIDDVIFIPPDPKTHILSGGAFLSDGSGKIYLKSSDGAIIRSVSVSLAGQVTF